MVNKILIGIITFVILVSSVYFMIPDSVRIDISDTKTTFKVYEDNSWILSGTEYTKIFDGTKLMRANNRDTNYTIDGNSLIFKELHITKIT